MHKTGGRRSDANDAGIGATQPSWLQMMKSLDLDLGMTTTHAERHIEKRKKKKRKAGSASTGDAASKKISAGKPNRTSGTRSKAASWLPKGKKGGPQPVEYMCALCNECYSSKCDDNPVVAHPHECSQMLQDAGKSGISITSSLPLSTCCWNCFCRLRFLE
jgi:hypothetical protein